MTDTTSQDHYDMMNLVYGEMFLEFADIAGKNEFYGIAGERAVRFAAEKLGLDDKCHVLDIGSGIGGPARYFAKEHGCKVTGIDISKYNIKAAQERTKEANLDHLVDFIHGDALKVSIPDSSFTHVFDCEAWCHLSDKRPLYKLAYQLLKQKGHICFLEGTKHSPIELKQCEKVWGNLHYESIERLYSHAKRSRIRVNRAL